MGNEPANNSMMSRALWRLVLLISSDLEPSEREAVLGDLAESGAAGFRAVCDVLGLELRRQTKIWADWRPWLFITTLVLPLSVALVISCDRVAVESAVYTWMYANNWDWALTTNVGFWYVFGEVATRVLTRSLGIVCWSWSVGFALGRLPHPLRAAVHWPLLVLLGLLQMGNAPQRIIYAVMAWHYHYVPPLPVGPDPNAPVNALAFYRVIFPFLILGLLVALPAMSGIRQGRQSALLHPKIKVLLLFAAVLTISMMLLKTPGFGFLLGASDRQWLRHSSPTLRILGVVAYWPTLYFLGMAFSRRGLNPTTAVQGNHG